jgi:hypothetical protein
MARVASARFEQTYRYSFALDGGAISTIPLRGPKLPSGLIVVDALLLVDTVPTGASATGALQVEAANDVQTAVVISGAPWSTLGAKRLTLTATTAPVRLTADRAPSLVIAAGAFTAGAFRLVLSCVEVV